MIELLRQNIRLAALIAVVLILLVVVIVLLLQWQSAEGDLDDVEKDRAIAEIDRNRTLADYDVDKLQADMAQLSAKPRFPEEMPIVELMLHVANGAPMYAVSITQVVPAATVGTETIGGRSYHAYKTQVTVTGTLTNIISYLKYIERGRFNSIKIEDVSLRGSGGSWQGKFTIVVITE